MADREWPLIIPVDDRDYWESLADEQREQATAWATEILWALSGRVFGTWLDKVRPCHRPPRRGSTYAGTFAGGGSPVFASAGMVLGSIAGTIAAAYGCGCESDDCRHQSAADLALPGPIAAVIRVAIDGDDLDPDTYRIRNRRWLRRVDGLAWPTRQNLNAADDEPGSFVVEYRRGIVPPQAGQLAAGVLAVEWVKDRDGRECRLPRGVTSANRNGLQVELDPRAFFTEGMTGIDEVDQWLISINPNRISAPVRMVGRPLVSRFDS